MCSKNHPRDLPDCLCPICAYNAISADIEKRTRDKKWETFKQAAGCGSNVPRRDGK